MQQQHPLFTADAAALQITDRRQAVAFYRDLFRNTRNLLKQGYMDGREVLALIAEWTEFVDHLLCHFWQWHGLLQDTAISLLAVGGYGRRQLFPGSDVDVLLLVPAALSAHSVEAIQHFMSFAWDVGLQLSHSTRTVADCMSLGQEDITIATNLLEARYITGNSESWLQLQQQLSSTSFWPDAQFFQAKLAEHQQRLLKYNATEYLLEPDIKNSAGGLRDIHLILWITRRYYHASEVQYLCEKKILTATEVQWLQEGYHFLSRIRFALHSARDRCDDRLSFEQQKYLAQLLAYRDQPHALAIEQFMKDYYRQVRTISNVCELFLQMMREILLEKDQPLPTQMLNNDFEVVNHTIKVKHSQLFQQQPHTILKLFLYLARDPHIIGIRAATLRLLLQVHQWITADFRAQAMHQQLFLQLLQQPQGVFAQLQRMSHYGILGEYLPVFGNIVGQIQFNLFHAYTVDQHSLLLIRHLEMFRNQENVQFAHCQQIMQQFTKPELLYIAALFHDIAKGREGDHSELGAVDAEQFCQQHRLDADATALVAWLVRDHLLMSTVAQRRDIHDPDVISEFVARVLTLERLNALYLLTVADICATHQELWNGWKETLLRNLYDISVLAITKQARTQVVMVRSRKQKALQQLLSAGIDPERLQQLWSHLGNNYFIQYNTQEVVWHSTAILQHDSHQALVLINTQANSPYTDIFVYASDQDYLFANCVAVISRSNLNILEAKIITSKDGYALDLFRVLRHDGRPLQLSEEIAQLQTRMQQALTVCRPVTVNATIPYRFRHFSVPTEIRFSHDAKNDRTVLEIVTLDRLGLLALIGAVFVEFGVRLHTAKITTLGERAEDIFYITDQQQHAITDSVLQQSLQQKLLQLLDQE